MGATRVFQEANDCKNTYLFCVSKYTNNAYISYIRYAHILMHTFDLSVHKIIYMH